MWNAKTNKYIVRGKRLLRIYLMLLFKDHVMFFYVKGIYNINVKMIYYVCKFIEKL